MCVFIFIEWSNPRVIMNKIQGKVRPKLKFWELLGSKITNTTMTHIKFKILSFPVAISSIFMACDWCEFRPPAVFSVICSSLSRTAGLNSGTQSELRVFFLPLSLGMSADTRHTWQTPAISGCKDDEAVPSRQHQISSNLLTASGLYKDKLLKYGSVPGSLSIPFSVQLTCLFTLSPAAHLTQQACLSLAFRISHVLSIFNEPYLDIRHFVLCVGGVRASEWK